MSKLIQLAALCVAIAAFLLLMPDAMLSASDGEQPRGTCTVSPSHSYVYLPSNAVRTSVAVQVSALCTGKGGTLTVQLKDNGRIVNGTKRSCVTKGRSCTATSGFVANVRGRTYSAAADAFANP